MTVQDIYPGRIRARELYGDYWLNSEPIPIASQKGRVVLLEFWDFAHISCLRTLPYLEHWHKKYREYGLVVVGVHSPRHEFGKNPEKVERAVNRLGITYSVVLDNEQTIAMNYEVRSYPSMVVIDKDGFIRCLNIGEGDYDATEQIIQSLLYDAGVSESLPLLMEPVRREDIPGAVSYRVSPELIAGYVRGNIGNTEGSSPETEMEFMDPGVYIDGKLYFDGTWFVGRDYLQFAGKEDASGKILLKYYASEVHSVFAPSAKDTPKVWVLQDGKPVSRRSMGEDVVVGPDGRTFFEVSEARNYSLVCNPEFGHHTLSLITDSDSVQFYSVSFVSGVIPETISRN